MHAGASIHDATFGVVVPRTLDQKRRLSPRTGLLGFRMTEAITLRGIDRMSHRPQISEVHDSGDTKRQGLRRAQLWLVPIEGDPTHAEIGAEARSRRPASCD